MVDLFADIFTEGGIFSWVVLLFGVLHAIPVLAQLGLCRKVDFSGYLWGGIAGILLVGLLGTVIGGVRMFAALAFAAPDERGAMIAMGVSIALLPLILAVILAVPGVFFSGIAATLARNLAPRSARHAAGKGA